MSTLLGANKTSIEAMIRGIVVAMEANKKNVAGCGVGLYISRGLGRSSDCDRMRPGAYL